MMVAINKEFAGFDALCKLIAVGIETLGLAILVVGAVATTGAFIVDLWRERTFAGPCRKFRSTFGKAILLALEFLVAADIVGTVAVGPTFQDLGVLALLVLIRTFLSFALEVEISGRWPWQGVDEGNAEDGGQKAKSPSAQG